MYTRGGKASGGSGSCPGSLDDCIALCPAHPVSGQLHKKFQKNTRSDVKIQNICSIESIKSIESTRNIESIESIESITILQVSHF